MRLGRLLIIFALLLIVGLAAVLFFFRSDFGGAGDAAQVETDLIDIVIVTQPIPRGAVITQDALGLIALPRSQGIEGMFTDTSQAVGKRAKFDLAPPVPLTQSMVVEDISELSDIGSDHALLIPQGMVAISVPISRFSSMGYGLERGDHVNVIATLLFVDLDQSFQTRLPNNTSAVIAPGPNVLLTIDSEDATNASLQTDEELNNITAQVISGGSVAPQGRAELDSVLNQPFYLVPSEKTQRPRMVSQTLLQDVVVLHVGDFPQDGQAEDAAAESAAQAQTAEDEAPAPPPQPDIITLIVTPQDAVTINYLVYAGAQLNLVLRANGDVSRIQTEAVTLQFLLEQYNIPLPARLTYGLEPRIDLLTPPVLENDQIR